MIKKAVTAPALLGLIIVLAAFGLWGGYDDYGYEDDGYGDERYYEACNEISDLIGDLPTDEYESASALIRELTDQIESACAV